MSEKGLFLLIYFFCLWLHFNMFKNRLCKQAHIEAIVLSVKCYSVGVQSGGFSMTLGQNIIKAVENL